MQENEQDSTLDMYKNLPVLDSAAGLPLTTSVPNRAVSGDVVECCRMWGLDKTKHSKFAYRKMKLTNS